jgi:hypothetical protein
MAFGIEDQIPFHIQLTGDTRSFSHFLNLPKPTLPFPVSSAPSDSPAAQEPTVKVLLEREVLANLPPLNGRKTLIIGEATVRSVPPPPNSIIEVDELSMNWEGEVKAKPEALTFGSFRTACLSVTASSFLV